MYQHKLYSVVLIEKETGRQVALPGEINWDNKKNTSDFYHDMLLNMIIIPTEHICEAGQWYHETWFTSDFALVENVRDGLNEFVVERLEAQIVEILWKPIG